MINFLRFDELFPSRDHYDISKGAFDLRTRTRRNLTSSLCACSKKKKASIYVFSPKKLVRVFILKEVKLYSDSKMILLLNVFDNLFPTLRHSR